MRTLALPETVKHWSLTSLREKLVKIGAKIVTYAAARASERCAGFNRNEPNRYWPSSGAVTSIFNRL